MMSSDAADEFEEPWDAARRAIWEWRDRFDSHIAEIDTELDSQLDAEPSLRAKRLLKTVTLAPELFKAMREQRFGRELSEAVEKVSDSPIEAMGLDARRLYLLDAKRLARLNLDAELIEYLFFLVEAQQETMLKRYTALLVGAHEGEPPSPIAEDYIQKAARLLVLGLDVECVVFCRAALEAALKSRIDDDKMASEGFKKRFDSRRSEYLDYDLYTRIKSAVKIKLFDDDAEERAHKLRKIGNDAVHPADPEKYDGALQLAEASSAFVSLSILVRKLLPAFSEG